MKQLLTTITLILTLFLTISPSFAKHYNRHAIERHSFEDRARVIKVKPIYETIEVITPEESCIEEKVITQSRRHHRKNYGGIVIGGILGGVAGHQVGRGRGKDVATIAGSILGAVIGDNVAKTNRRPYKNHKHIHYETHCDTINTVSYQKEIVAYDVKYRYKGHNYWTQTNNHPGKYIDVKVKLTPTHLAKR